ncbi:PREDICTED: uncharacterized protein LOC104817073 [Tarenaya hassleriana]|uniref:uncharacterized protein LOC104817073 n=1 Tax=Tarenaya hassleriana TaxID=28532 RepID=UPI00053C1507|nr:PREDICTED: uncharacterized protein LOC104817073 [Tarenaya hassleriana]
MTPFKALYGRDPPTLHRDRWHLSPNDTIEKMLEDRDAIIAELQANLSRAQSLMTAGADAKRRDIEFQEGDIVYLKFRPYCMRALSQRRYEKLAPRYSGPFSVEKRIGKVAYRLKLPSTTRIHPDFHVSQLKLAVGVGPRVETQSIPSDLTPELKLIVEPKSIQKIRARAKDGGQEVLMRWKDLPPFEDTWETVETVERQFPDFHHEDKVKLLGGSIDRPPL